MGLRDDARAGQASVRKGPICGVARAQLAMDDDERAELLELLDDPLIMGTVLARALKAQGWPVSDGAINRHRRGACSCDPAR